MKNEIKHTAHSTYRCEYHIVFAPKYRRKYIYGQIKKDIGEIIRKLCNEKKVEILMQRKESRNTGGRGLPRPYTYAYKCTAVFKYSTIYGISQG